MLIFKEMEDEDIAGISVDASINLAMQVHFFSKNKKPKLKIIEIYIE